MKSKGIAISNLNVGGPIKRDKIWWYEQPVRGSPVRRLRLLLPADCEHRRHLLRARFRRPNLGWRRQQLAARSRPAAADGRRDVVQGRVGRQSQHQVRRGAPQGDRLGGLPAARQRRRRAPLQQRTATERHFRFSDSDRRRTFRRGTGRRPALDRQARSDRCLLQRSMVDGPRHAELRPAVRLLQVVDPRIRRRRRSPTIGPTTTRRAGRASPTTVDTRSAKRAR